MEKELKDMDIVEAFVDMVKQIDCKADDIVFIGAILSDGSKICCEKHKNGDLSAEWTDDKPWMRKKTLTQLFVEAETLDKEWKFAR